MNLFIVVVAGCMPLLAPLSFASSFEEDKLDKKRQRILTHRLSEAVDAATPEARLQAANELAKDKTIGLDEWKQVMEAFPHRPHQPTDLADTPRPTHHENTFTVEVNLQVLEGVEPTELAICVPPSYDFKKPHGLLVLLHGAGQGASSMMYDLPDWLDSLDLLVLAPSETGQNMGYTGRPREKASILQALRWMRRHYNVDENRIYIAGFSRGAHLVWDLSLRFPDLFAAAVPMAGAPRYKVRHGLNNLRYAGNLWQMPIRQLIGEKESEAMLLSVREAFRRIEEEGSTNAELIIQEGIGHNVNMRALDFSEFFESSERKPVPSATKRWMARTGEGRAFWMEITKAKRRGVEEIWVPRMPKGTKGTPPADQIFEWVREQADARTAHASAELVEPGEVRIRSKKVDKLRLFVTTEMMSAKGSVIVSHNGRKSKKKPKASTRVLLTEFVERFDRTFLPVAILDL